jgi:hypothetical protein
MVANLTKKMRLFINRSPSRIIRFFRLAFGHPGHSYAFPFAGQ